ncbi:hypothetical protein J6590_043824 [Homalodisca vitripennis]|nr:hypothetical protein J6590_043824 [Homalodisca vitripennis]
MPLLWYSLHQSSVMQQTHDVSACELLLNCDVATLALPPSTWLLCSAQSNSGPGPWTGLHLPSMCHLARIPLSPLTREMDDAENMFLTSPPSRIMIRSSERSRQPKFFVSILMILSPQEPRRMSYILTTSLASYL